MKTTNLRDGGHLFTYFEKSCTIEQNFGQRVIQTPNFEFAENSRGQRKLECEIEWGKSVERSISLSHNISASKAHLTEILLELN